jgi:hypothetical protein
LKHFVACHAVSAGAKLRATVTPDGGSVKRAGYSFALGVFLLPPLAAAPLACAQELPNLPPITSEDLALKDNPRAKGSAAMILYCTVDTDNRNGTETESFRIKVFQGDGKKYADVEIPYSDKETRRPPGRCSGCRAAKSQLTWNAKLSQ